MTSLTLVVLGTFPRVRVMFSFGVPVDELGSSKSIGVDAISIMVFSIWLAGILAHRITYMECIMYILRRWAKSIYILILQLWSSVECDAGWNLVTLIHVILPGGVRSSTKSDSIPSCVHDCSTA